MKLPLRPASAAWLLRHEMRLQWRASGGRGAWILGIAGSIFWAFLHLSAWGLVQVGSSSWITEAAVPLFGSGVWLAWSLMLSQAILLSVRALFDRGDLDLLLSSPLDTHTVFLVRGLGIAVGCTVFPLFLLSPLAHAGVALGQFHLLGIYPTLLALGLLAAATGMWATLALVRLLGARRARTLAQVAGALAGASLFLLVQASAWLGDTGRARLAGWLLDLSAPGAAFDAHSPLWLPLRALLGEPVALVSTLAFGLGSFGLVIALAHRRFLAGTQESVTRPAAPMAHDSRLRFHTGLRRNVLLKEWRLIARDPQLVAQTLLQLLYLAPLVLLFARRDPAATLIVPAVVMLAGGLASSLAWLTVTAEDAPELIGTAPVSLGRIRWLKVGAALAPVWLLLSPVLCYLLLTNLPAGLTLAACLAGSTVSAGVTQIWYPRRGDRRHMAQRSDGGRLVALFEGLTCAAWGGVAFCLLAAPWFTPLSLAATLVGPGLAWSLGRPLREQGQLV